MEDEADIVAGAREVFGDRLHGVFLFGSRDADDALVRLRRVLELVERVFVQAGSASA